MYKINISFLYIGAKTVWVCKIHQLHLCRRERPLPQPITISVLDMMLDPLMVRLWFWNFGEYEIPLQCPLQLAVIIPVRVPCMGQIEIVFKQHLTVKLQSWNFQECEELFHCHYSQVYSDLEWLYLSGSHLWVKSSSSCHAASTDIPDPLSPLFPIVHRLWQVFRATSHILT